MMLATVSAWFAADVPAQHVWALVVLYVGPDQILPLTSIVGALVGIVLIGWRYLVGLAGRLRQYLSRR
jgi:hypothetical protein